jgi:hypothetical protein
MLQYFLFLILRTSRDTAKLGILKLGVFNVDIMNFGCFENGLFGVHYVTETLSWHLFAKIRSLENGLKCYAVLWEFYVKGNY